MPFRYRLESILKLRIRKKEAQLIVVQKAQQAVFESEERIRQNEAEIRKILGFDFDLFISNNSLFSDSSLDQQRNYNGIVLSSSQYNVNEFLNKVDNEVQKDIGKAELLNISLEELRSKEVINNDLQIDEVDSSYVPASRKK